MNITELEQKINFYYDNNSTDNKKKAVLKTVKNVLKLLNKGKIRVLDNLWVKKAILLAFKYGDCKYDRKFDSYDKVGLNRYSRKDKRYRKIPGAIIRDGVYIGDGCVIMPSYINIGAYIGDGTMIDINSSIGSCAQIGKNCHISANSVIGGVLEPVSADPVIVEDNCFIGANSAVLEGVIVRKGAIVASGTIVTSSTRIIDRKTGDKLPYGEIPECAVAVPGSYLSMNGVHINCVVIVKEVDLKSESKLELSESLRLV